MTDKKDPSSRAERSGVAVALGIGWDLAVCTGLSFWFGYWLDGRFRTSPWGVLVSTLTGICFGLYRLIRTFGRPPDRGSRRG